MMNIKKRYFVFKEQDGSVSMLARVCEDETKLWGEYLSAGKWINHSPITNLLHDPYPADEISEEEANEFMQDNDRT